MKKSSFKYWALSLGLLLGVTSCTDLDFVESDSILDVGFEGVADPSSAVEALYNEFNALGDQANTFALMEVTTGEQLIPTRGSDWGDNGLWRQLHEHGWTPNHSFVIDGFNRWSSTQLRASQILDARSNPSPENIGEASFLRAMSMWLILDLYGQVPFRDTTDDTGFPTVMSGEDAIAFILADLATAQANLPARGPAGFADNSRANRSAAMMLEARVLLNRGVYNGTGNFDAADMARVITLVDQVEADGYALQSGFFDLFRDTADNETVWFLETAVGNRIWNTLHYLQSPEIAGGGWNGFSTLAEYYDLFEGDPLLNVGDVTTGAPMNNQEERRGYVPSRGATEAEWATRFPGAAFTDGNGDGFHDGSNVGFGLLAGPQHDYDGTVLRDRPDVLDLNFSPAFVDGSGASNLINNSEVTGRRMIKYNPSFGGFTAHEIFFRFADAHLMRAEAMMRSGNAGAALAEVNELRVLRSASPLGSMSEQDMLDERRRELYIEFVARTDDRRFGQFLRDWELKTPSEVGNTTRDLFPIPSDQLLANPNLVQNPGY